MSQRSLRAHGVPESVRRSGIYMAADTVVTIASVNVIVLLQKSSRQRTSDSAVSAVGNAPVRKLDDTSKYLDGKRAEIQQTKRL